MNEEKTEEKQQNKEEHKEPQEILGVDTPIVLTTGFGVASAGDLLIISFIFTPPENPKIVKVLSRLAVPTKVGEALSKSIREVLDQIGKSTGKKQQPSKEPH